MKDRQIDTTIDGFRHVGINLTKEQYDDLCTLTRISKNSPTSIGGEMNCHLLHSAIVGM